MKRREIGDAASGLCEGWWLICKLIDGRKMWRVRQLSHSESGLIVVGMGQLVDDYIASECATFVKLVDFPPDPELWSEADCTAIARAYVRLVKAGGR
jgi:hypothetical protein